MCIIVAKEKEVALPSVETLKNCFSNNNDGAGFMYVDKGNVIIDKGYMTFETFIKHFEKLCRKYNDFKNKALVMHFRIGTSGSNTKENTHPYCISRDFKELHQTKVITKLGMVHNGIISQYNPKGENVNNVNDTQEFIMKYLAPLYEHYEDFYKNEYILSGLDDITGSKLAFLDTNEDIYYVGDFEQMLGVKYSNSTYVKDYYVNKYYGNYWSDMWNANTHDYDKEYNDYGYVYNDEETLVEEYDKNNLVKLQSDWYIANEFGIESVGDRSLYVDEYTYKLYEEKSDGSLYEIGENTFVYDKDYLEVV